MWKCLRERVNRERMCEKVSVALVRCWVRVRFRVKDYTCAKR